MLELARGDVASPGSKFCTEPHLHHWLGQSIIGMCIWAVSLCLHVANLHTPALKLRVTCRQEPRDPFIWLTDEERTKSMES